MADSTGEQPPSLTVRVAKIFRSKKVILTLGRGRVQLQSMIHLHEGHRGTYESLVLNDDGRHVPRMFGTGPPYVGTICEKDFEWRTRQEVASFFFLFLHLLVSSGIT